MKAYILTDDEGAEACDGDALAWFDKDAHAIVVQSGGDLGERRVRFSIDEDASEARRLAYKLLEAAELMDRGHSAACMARVLGKRCSCQ